MKLVRHDWLRKGCFHLSWFLSYKILHLATFSLAFRIRASSDFATRQSCTLAMRRNWNERTDVSISSTGLSARWVRRLDDRQRHNCRRNIFKLERNRTTWSSSSNELGTQTTPPSTNLAHKPHKKVVWYAYVHTKSHTTNGIGRWSRLLERVLAVQRCCYEHLCVKDFK